jgi:hypothetical protein
MERMMTMMPATMMGGERRLIPRRPAMKMPAVMATDAREGMRKSIMGTSF